MTIPLVIGVNPLQTTWLERGIVSGRVALLLRSAEIHPLFERFVRWTTSILPSSCQASTLGGPGRIRAHTHKVLTIRSRHGALGTHIGSRHGVHKAHQTRCTKRVSSLKVKWLKILGTRVSCQASQTSTLGGPAEIELTRPRYSKASTLGGPEKLELSRPRYAQGTRCYVPPEL